MLNIIIPAYNCEKTLAKALSSLVAQTYKGLFTVTVVDDCSSQDLETIVKKYEESLIINYYKLEENKGVGFCRNYGVEKSPEACDYLLFLDSDDYLMPYALEYFMREIRTNKPEVIISDFFTDIRKEIVTYFNKITWTHGKCYSKEFLKKYNITFPNIRANEDSGFNAAVFSLATNIKNIKMPMYLWTYNPKSLTHSEKDFYIKCIPLYIKSLSFTYKTLENYYEEEKVKKNLIKYLIQIYYYYQIELYHNILNYKEITKDSIKGFFNENSSLINKLTKDKDFESVLIENINKNLPESQISDYKVTQTFDSFLEEFMINRKRIYIINGGGGVGKDEFVNQVRNCGKIVFNISTVDRIKEIADFAIPNCGEGKTQAYRKLLSDLKDVFTEHNNLSFNDCIEKISNNKADIYFIHCREPEEIKKFVDYCDAETILVTNPNVEIISSNHADLLVNDYDYDYVIDNNGTIEELYEKAKAFINKK